MIEGTINAGLSVPKLPTKDEAIDYLKSHQYLVSGDIDELLKDLRRPEDKRIHANAERDIEVLRREYSCLGVAILTLEGRLD